MAQNGRGEPQELMSLDSVVCFDPENGSWSSQPRPTTGNPGHCLGAPIPRLAERLNRSMTSRMDWDTSPPPSMCLVAAWSRYVCAERYFDFLRIPMMALTEAFVKGMTHWWPPTFAPGGA